MTFVPPPLPTDPPPTPPADLTEWQYYSQFSTDTIGIIISPNDTPTDPTGNSVSLQAFLLPSPGTQGSATPVWSGLATRTGVGTYTWTFSASTNTNNTGFFRLDWSYYLNGTLETASTWIEIGPPSPAYDALGPSGRQLVNDVWAKFSDGYDSPQGGPNLQMWYQTHFNRGRVAQLLNQAIQHINVAAQPPTGYSAAPTPGPEFPYAQWMGLANTALTVEVLKHLMRSYVEDPDIQGSVQARMNRRDYLQRWQSLLDVEAPLLKEQRDVWKISFMFVMTPRVLVSGGAYGNYSPVRPIGNTVARPIYWWRFY